MVKVQKPQPISLSNANKLGGVVKEKKSIKKAKVDNKKIVIKVPEKKAIKLAAEAVKTPPAKQQPKTKPSKKPLVLAPPPSPAAPAPKVAKKVATKSLNAPKNEQKITVKAKPATKPTKQVKGEKEAKPAAVPVAGKSKPEPKAAKLVKTGKVEKPTAAPVAKNVKKQPESAKPKPAKKDAKKPVENKEVKVVAKKAVNGAKNKGIEKVTAKGARGAKGAKAAKAAKGAKGTKQRKALKKPAKKVVELDFELQPFDEDKFNNIVSEANVLKVCGALKAQVADEVQQKKKATTIFSDYRYILQVCCYKIPSCPKRVVKLPLTHSLVGKDDDVALIVTDLQRGARFECEPTMQHYEDLLREAGVEQRLTVVPFNRLRNDMVTIEAKRKFLNSYDYLLCDGRISGQATAFLGNNTQKPRNVLHAVRLTKPDQLTKEISRALCRTAFRQLRKGDLTAIPVGNHEHSGQELTENILGVVKQLQQQYPGGLANIRSMYLKIDIVGTSSLPLYVSLCSPPAAAPYVVGPREQRMLKLKKQANEVLTKFALTKDVGFVKLTRDQVKRKAELREKRLALKAEDGKEPAKDDDAEEPAVPAKKARKNVPLKKVKQVSVDDEEEDIDDEDDEEDDDEDN